MLLVSAVVAICGLAMLAWAVRGRRVGDGVYCGRCGFDFTGLVLSATLTSQGTVEQARCPECGQEAWRVGHTRVGRRERVGLMWKGAIGAACLLMALAGGIGAMRSGTAWLARMPNWVVLAKADGWLGRADREVMKEVVRRLPALVSGPGVSGGGGTSAAVAAPGSWTNQQLGVLAGRAKSGIERAQSPQEATDWVRVYEHAMGVAGLTNPAQMHEVAGAACGVSLRIRELVRRGEQLVVDFEPQYRIVQNAPTPLSYVAHGITMRVRTQEGGWGDPIPLDFGRYLQQPGLRSPLVSEHQGAAITLSPGAHEVKVEGEYSTYFGVQSVPRYQPLSAADVATIEAMPRRSVEWVGTLRVVDEDTPAIDLEGVTEAQMAEILDVKVVMLRWVNQPPVSGSGILPHCKWGLRLLIDHQGEKFASGARIVVQGRSATGDAIGEAWRMRATGRTFGGTRVVSFGTPEWEWDTRFRCATARFGLDAPLYDVTFEPDVRRIEKSMLSQAIAAKLEIRGLRVMDAPGGIAKLMADFETLDNPMYADWIGRVTRDGVVAVTPTEMMKSMRDDEARFDRAVQEWNQYWREQQRTPGE